MRCSPHRVLSHEKRCGKTKGYLKTKTTRTLKVRGYLFETLSDVLEPTLQVLQLETSRPAALKTSSLEKKWASRNERPHSCQDLECSALHVPRRVRKALRSVLVESLASGPQVCTTEPKQAPLTLKVRNKPQPRKQRFSIGSSTKL